MKERSESLLAGPQVFLGSLALGDVLDSPYRLNEPAGVIKHRLATLPNHADLAAWKDNPIFDHINRSVLGCFSLCLFDSFAVIGMDRFNQLIPVERFRLVLDAPNAKSFLRTK